MKGMGKGIKSFKEGMKGMEEEINQPVKPSDYKEADKEKPAESKPELNQYLNPFPFIFLSF